MFGNTSYEPEYQAWNDHTNPGFKCPSGSEPSSDEQAVNCVDFCDAAAYCEWAGKRLCGRAGGPTKWGKVDVGVKEDGGNVAQQWEALEQVAKSSVMEFGYVCTQADKTTYAYGNAYEAGRCIDSEWVAQKGQDSLEVADLSNRACHGSEAPFNEIYDLSGSVEEWQNLCGITGGMSCLIIGGSWADKEANLQSCSGSVKMGLSAPQMSPTVGFRCCTDGVAGPNP